MVCGTVLRVLWARMCFRDRFLPLCSHHGGDSCDMWHHHERGNGLDGEIHKKEHDDESNLTEKLQNSVRQCLQRVN